MADKKTFDNIRRALAEYDAGAAARQGLWDSIHSVKDFDIADNAESEAQKKLDEAFYEDTKDINNRRQCENVPIHFLRRLTEVNYDN